MFVRNNWYVAAWGHEVVEGQILPRVLLDEPVIFYRTSDGAAVALEDRCCHRGVPLSRGRAVGDDRVRCGYHGLEFDRTGACVRVPGQDIIPPSARVRKYTVVEKNKLVWIWMGEADRADPSLIMDFRWHDDPQWHWKPGHAHVRANHLMVTDNLLDLSHVAYVHTTSLGGDPDDHGRALMKTRRSADGVKLMRLMRGTVPGPFHVKYGGFKGNVDRYQIVEFSPGWVTIDSGMTEAGYISEDFEIAPDTFNLNKIVFNGLTPESDGTTHYFYSIAHAFGGGRADVVDALARDFDKIFEEDAIILEAQYERLRLDPHRPLVDINSDVAAIQARRIVERRLADERNAIAAQ
jgi:vanillate O-demethylase monooxygenase subunit